MPPVKATLSPAASAGASGTVDTSTSACVPVVIVRRLVPASR
jgi:hypothetical protein